MKNLMVTDNDLKLIIASVGKLPIPIMSDNHKVAVALIDRCGKLLLFNPVEDAAQTTQPKEN